MTCVGALLLEDSKLFYLSGNSAEIVACACSNTHFLGLTKDGDCFGYGSNEKGQLEAELGDRVEKWTRLNLPMVREITAGKQFSIFITKSGDVLFRGDFYKSEEPLKFIAPRGLSSNGSTIALCDHISNVHLFTETSKEIIVVEREAVISTALTKDTLVVLTALGNLYKGSIGSGILQGVELSFPVRSIFASYDTLHVTNPSGSVLEVRERAIPIPVRCGSVTVNVVKRAETIIRLTSTGEIIGNIEKPNFKVSCFAVSNNCVAFFRGRPDMSRVTSPPPEHLHPLCGIPITVTSKTNKVNILALDATTSYCENESHYRRLDEIERLLVSPCAAAHVTSDPAQTVFYTQSGRIVLPASDSRVTFSFNLLNGDIIETPAGVRACFVGITGNQAWFRISGDRCLMSVINPRHLEIHHREGHQMKKSVVDGELVIFDETPSFCETFGRCIGDLIWFPNRGIVQIAGLYSNKYVLFDFSDFSLFSAAIEPYMLIRTRNRKCAHMRRIVTTEGNAVNLDVCGLGRIYQPGDRVLSEYGEAMILGHDSEGVCYVQSDEMRVHEIQGAPVTEFNKLRLLRRIGMKATRSVVVNGVSLTLSLSVMDRVNGLFAADVIKHNDFLYRVVGTQKEEIYAENMTNGEICCLKSEATLVYRADINGRNYVEGFEVGTPVLDMSFLVPNDTVMLSNGKVYVFGGVGANGLVFIDQGNREAFTTSYSPMVLSETLQVTKREVFSGCGQK